MTKAMDDVVRWLGEIKEDLDHARTMLTLGRERGDWGQVVEAGKVLRGLYNRLSNLEHLALPENWRMLADRNGVHVKEDLTPQPPLLGGEGE